MKIIKQGEDLFIKADDIVNYINGHKQRVKDNNSIIDPELLRWYLLAHDHLKASIEHEIRLQKMEGKIDEGNSDNSDNLCNIGDDLLDKQEEVKKELAERILADEVFMNQLMDLTKSLTTAVMPIVNVVIDLMAKEIESSLSE